MANKAGKICNSSSGHSHCPDRASEMIFKSSKACSLLPSDLSSFPEGLQAQKCIVYQSLLSMSSACFGLCATKSRLVKFGPAAFCFLDSRLLASCHLLFLDSRIEFEFPTITRGILCIHLLFWRQFPLVPSLPLASAHMAVSDLPDRCQELSWVSMFPSWSVETWSVQLLKLKSMIQDQFPTVSYSTQCCIYTIYALEEVKHCFDGIW